ncbi:vacuolar sorting protein 39 isoform X1 [Zingiber officinale]|uniref:vacuolar sorting protein 39 isoform X1 n=2 Tax=Zingiber officinale TaxID=94328 RepID=UPI001C4B01B1|nr:vacuolar sorting protein 39 isoform X1 [Zingiber officinale]
MVHSAYDSVELLKGSSARIDAAVAYGSKILLGCSDSSLRIYAPSSATGDGGGDDGPPADDLEIQREAYVLERTVSGFWKRAPLAMEVCQSRDLLLSLSEWVALHRLPNLETVVAIGKTKGAHIFCWDDRKGFLCVGRQKRVAIYRLDGGREFVEIKDFGVPDVVKSMAWCGENICVGVRREYMIMNSTTGALSEIFSSGRIAPSLVAPLSPEELLLGKDNIGVFVDQNGKLLQDGRICWSETPGSVIIQKPYAIGRLPRHIEIRSLRAPYPLIQTVGLRDVRLLLQSNSSLIAALNNAVYCLLPVPLGAQIVQLTASGNFEEALSLCKLLPPEDASLRASKESSIHIRYAHHLFDNGSYEEAMEEFLASQVDITYVLSLYPSILLPNLHTIPVLEKFVDSNDELLLSRASSDASDEIESSLPSQQNESGNPMLENKKMNHNALMALVKFLQKKRYGIFERATAEVTEEVVQDSISSYEPYRSKASSKKRGNTHISSVAREMATVLDTALLQALILTGQPSGALELLKGSNYCDLKICENFLMEKCQYTVLLELYKYNEMHRDALKLLNQLIEESNSGGETKSEHTMKFRPNMIIEYLKPLCRTDPMIVLEFSMNVLESCPTETIELFLSGNVPAELVNSYLKQNAPNMQSTYLELMLSMSENAINPKLQNELVHLYLSEVVDWFKDLKEQQKWDEKLYSPTRKKLLSALDNISGYNADDLLKRLPIDALYEERAILLGRLNQHQLALSLYVHKLQLPELALSYCDHVYDTALQQPSRANANIYLTLLQIYLNPRRAIKELEQRTASPFTGISQSPGIQKSGYAKTKMSRQSKKIVEIERADDMRISLSGTDSSRSDGDVDEVIDEGDSIMLKEALDLLGQRWDRINGAQALRVLPRDIKLQDLLPFLKPLLRKSTERRQNSSVIKNLTFNENLQVKEELYNCRRAILKVDADSMCSLCNKRIGSSVFAVYPNGKTLVHFVCFRDSQSIKAVRGPTSTRRK